MDDTVGKPILTTDYMDIGTMHKMASTIIGDELGDPALAGKVLNRLLNLIESSSDRDVALAKKAGDSYCIGIFPADGSEPLMLNTPRVPREFSDLEVQSCLMQLLTSISEEYGCYVDWGLSQVLCGFGGDDPESILSLSEGN